MTKPRPRRPAPRNEYPNDNTVDIAVIYERIGHLKTSLENGFKNLADQEDQRVTANGELEERVASLEIKATSAKWFVIGWAAGGGAVGGVVATGIAKAFGG